MSITTVKRPSFIGKMGMADSAVELKDQGETLISMKMREEEDFNSAVVAEIGQGTRFQVVEVGSLPNRIRITTDASSRAGWISQSTERDQPLVKLIRKRRMSKEVGDLLSQKSSPELRTPSREEVDLHVDVGDVCVTLVPMKIRESEDFKSPAICQIPVQCTFEVIETGAGHRVKIVVPEAVLEGGAVGWISSHTDQGHPLCKKGVGGSRKSRTSVNLSRTISLNMPTQDNSLQKMLSNDGSMKNSCVVA